MKPEFVQQCFIFQLFRHWFTKQTIPLSFLAFARSDARLHNSTNWECLNKFVDGHILRCAIPNQTNQKLLINLNIKKRNFCPFSPLLATGKTHLNPNAKAKTTDDSKKWTSFFYNSQLFHIFKRQVL
jgi:hypothetical protein